MTTKQKPERGITEKQIDALARRIARDLFTDVWSNRAEILTAKVGETYTGSGWAERAMSGRIAKKLKRALIRPVQPTGGNHERLR